MGTVSTELDLEWESSKRRPPSAYANGLHVDAAKTRPIPSSETEEIK